RSEWLRTPSAGLGSSVVPRPRVEKEAIVARCAGLGKTTPATGGVVSREAVRRRCEGSTRSAANLARRQRLPQADDVRIRDHGFEEVKRPQLRVSLQFHQPGGRHCGPAEVEVFQLSKTRQFLQPGVRHPGVAEVERLQAREGRQWLQVLVRYLPPGEA